MYKVKANSGKEHRVSFENDGILLNGKLILWDQVKTGKNRFHILKDHRSFTCEVLSADHVKKKFDIKVNGKSFKVDVKDRFDELLHQLGMDKAVMHKVNTIKAPMPGLVLKIMVAERTILKEGDSVLILEAMKMENLIKSPGAGTVKAIKVNEQDAVEKNQVLIEIT